MTTATRSAASTRPAAISPVEHRPLVAVGVLAAAAGVVTLAALVVGAAASTAGGAFAPLAPATLVSFSVGGLLVAVTGWAVVRRMTRRPALVLRILVPTLLVGSLIPDVIVAPSIPGADLPGVLALALMHLIVVAVAVPVAQRLLPLR